MASPCGELTSKGTLCKNTNCHIHGSNIGTCSICLNNVRNTRSVSKLRCGHSFHRRCIDEWKSRTPTCPECRTLIDKYKVTIKIENIENAQSNIFAPSSSIDVLEFVARMGLTTDLIETQIDISFENYPDLNSFFRDLGIRLSDLNSAIFDTE